MQEEEHGDNMEREELIKNYFDFYDGKKYSLSKQKRKDAVKKALSQALSDFNFRTLKPILRDDKKVVDVAKEDKNRKVSDFLIEQLEWSNDDKKSFIEKFVEYFDNYSEDRTNFEKWHEERCGQFLSVVNVYYENVEYGKAQKIVNMMFKYLYCMDWDDVDYEKCFQHCHMAIDSYILDWYNNQKIGSEKITNSWSNLGKEKYKKIQDSIREKLTEGCEYTKYKFGKKRTKSKERIELDKTPIKAEFVIWFLETNYGKVRIMSECLEKLSNNDSCYDILLTKKDKEKIEKLLKKSITNP